VRCQINPIRVTNVCAEDENAKVAMESTLEKLSAFFIATFPQAEPLNW